MTKPLIDQAVDRFLGWKLPQDFAPDGGISFTPVPNHIWFPTGTNLLTAIQAKAMLEYAAAPLIGEFEKLERSFDDQSRELEIACEVMSAEQLTEFRHRAYPTLYPRT
jgi:hypothetical protein